MYRKKLLTLSICILSTCSASKSMVDGLITLGNTVRLALPTIFAAHDSINLLFEVDSIPQYLKSLKDPSAKINRWCQKHITKAGYTGITIKINTNNKIYSTQTVGNTIILSVSEEKLLETDLKEDAADEEQIDDIKEIIFGILHELGHIHYEDAIYRNKTVSIAKKIMPYIISALGAYSISYMSMTSEEETTTSLTEGLWYAGSSVFAEHIKYFTSRHIVKTLYAHYKEKRADLFACKKLESPEILEAAAKGFADHGITSIYTAIGQRVPSRYHHPDGTLHIEKIEQDLAALPRRARNFICRCIYHIEDPKHPYPFDRSRMLLTRALMLVQAEPMAT